jgi:hypothetical protein
MVAADIMKQLVIVIITTALTRDVLFQDQHHPGDTIEQLLMVLS